MLAKQLKKVTEERDLARQTIRDLYRRIREYQQAAHGEIDFA
jgi:prefoldin subunit 5